MQRITLSIDDDLAQVLDRHMAAHRYASRSEALRDILRDVQARQQLDEAPDAYCVATLSYVYDHETRDLGRRLTRTRHDHHDLQVATLHVYLDHDASLDVSVLRGAARSVRKFASDTISQRGVRHGQLHLVPAEHDRGRHSHGAGPLEHDHFHA
ncbi:MAG: nickel-responsive transcriptional regulator NikR [Reyranellaceae bacterium]